MSVIQLQPLTSTVAQMPIISKLVDQNCVQFSAFGSMTDDLEPNRGGFEAAARLHHHFITGQRKEANRNQRSRRGMQSQGPTRDPSTIPWEGH